MPPGVCENCRKKEFADIDPGEWFCKEPPPVHGCGEGEDGAGAGACCFGPGGGTPPTGGGPAVGPAGHGTYLRYQAGGVGNAGFPGAAAWSAALGRNWSHEFAERIVPETPGDPGTVWLLTRWGTFRKFSGLNDGVYTVRVPSDEYRRLEWTGSGWQLHELDGTLHTFDSSGRWLSTLPRNGHGPGWVGIYNGNALVRVNFPDGRHEEFEYHASGRLRRIIQVGRESTLSRTWELTWDGDDLERIDRPDGSAWSFGYDSAVHPGYLTRMTLIGAGGGPGRVEGAWEFDSSGNVVRTWKGAESFTDPAAVEKWELAYDDPAQPSQTTVIPPEGTPIVFVYDRDPASPKPRLRTIEGDCPFCGTSPGTIYHYDHPAPNQMRPSKVESARVLGGERLATEYDYSAYGRPVRKTEIANNPLAHPDLPRVTEWSYDPLYPALVTEVRGPFVEGTVPTRIVSYQYDPATGDLVGMRQEGQEEGADFPPAAPGVLDLTTSYTRSSAGQPLTVDPPGYGTDDVTTFLYGVSGANGLLASERSDPLAGTTWFGYDAFNRRTHVTNPNLEETVTAYDALDRVVSVTATGPPALVTTYHYSPLGDLFCLVLPRGNAIEYVHDGAGRLVAELRGQAVAAPAWPSCLDPGEPRERRLWTLDGAGQRTKEKLQRDEGGGGDLWVDHAETSWVYQGRCHLEKTIEAPGRPEEAVTEY
ncbi:MAG: RHS repeat protein, partial [Acidobacteria bacterium]|nr:RHS repeat protein [Acidobacteriota bacterium]